MGSTLAAWIDRILAKPIRHLFETPRRLLKGYVKEGMTVLDVGCGTGYFSLGMARLVGPTGQVVSVDTETEALEALRKKAEQAGLSGQIQARVCSEKDLEISDISGQFDFALAVYVVHHAQDAAALMSNIHGALKPGGELLIVEPGHHASAAERQAVEDNARRAGFTVADHPSLKRDWAVLFVKS
jgi:ubiquinone/menaquinone biosynthesis C-methylase UbiE